MASMKVHQFRHELFWDQHEPASLTVPAARGCTRLPNKPRNPPPNNVVRPLDLKCFIKPDNAGSRKIRCVKEMKQADEASVHAGGTRWIPTQEQISVLEILYKGGMRTPNTQQIEEIADQLANYGKIEGKNVFYWFQNHKARERQKIKRKKSLSSFSRHSPSPRIAPPALSTTAVNSPDASTSGDEERDADHSDHHYYKRKCRSWSSDDHCFELEGNNGRLHKEEDEEKTTLELFPLHPELGR